MKENIKEKKPVQKFNISSKNDIDCINFETKITNDTQNTKVKFLTKKKEFFKIERISEVNKKRPKNSNFNDGRWEKEEKMQFIIGIALYGNNWKKVKTLIKTRSAVQVRSHAQKFFKKMKSCKNDKLGIDFTLDSINNINDMIEHIKLVNPNYDIIHIFKELSHKFNAKYKFKSSKKKNKLNKNENEINNLPINEEQEIINDKEKEKDNKNLMNNHIIINNNFHLNKQNNLNKGFILNNIDIFQFNNNYNTNNLININNNNDNQNNNFPLPFNDNALNINISNDLLKYYLSINHNIFFFINSLHQLNYIISKQVENINSFIMINNNNLINLSNENNPNNNIPNNNLFYKINKQNENNNFGRKK